MERARRPIVVFLMAFSICTLAFSGSAQARGGRGGSNPTGSYLVDTTEVPQARLLLTVDKRNTLIFTSNTDFGFATTQGTPAHGTWRRQGKNTIEFVAYSFIMNNAGDLPSMTQRISGTATTSDDFETAALDILIEQFGNEQDVLSDVDPSGFVFSLTGNARRIPIPEDNDEDNDEDSDSDD